MGYIRHHAIIVTDYVGFSKDTSALYTAHEKAVYLFKIHDQQSPNFGLSLVSEIIHSAINRYATFIVAPDGSKECWEEDEHFNKARSEFIAWLKTQEALNYVEIEFGGDGDEAKIITDSYDTEHG